MGLVSKVHQGRVFLEYLIAALPGGFLQKEDRPGVIHVVLLVPSGAETVGPHGVQGGVEAQAQGIKRLAVVPFYPFADFL